MLEYKTVLLTCLSFFIGLQFVIRFQTFLNAVHGAAGQVDSEELALNCGYYDQSHMLKDFRAFAGTTPEKYKKLLKEKTTEKEKMIREE